MLDLSTSSSIICIFDDSRYTKVRCTRIMGRNFVTDASNFGRKKRDVFIAQAPMVDVFDASGNIVGIAKCQNIWCIIIITNRNNNTVIIKLHRCFPIHRCIVQLYRNYLDNELDCLSSTSVNMLDPLSDVLFLRIFSGKCKLSFIAVTSSKFFSINLLILT